MGKRINLYICTLYRASYYNYIHSYDVAKMGKS